MRCSCRDFRVSAGQCVPRFASRQPPLPRLPSHERCIAQQRWQHRHPLARATADAAGAFQQPQDNAAEPVNVLPRLKEQDPFKVLGIPDDSDFEEVQAARNYLVQEYANHEKSREHVELAYEKIVSQSFRARQLKGFRPGRGKRGDRVKYDIPPTRLQKLKGKIDTSPTLASGARDIAPFLFAGVWSAAAYPLVAAPTLLLFGYSVFRLVRKRETRTPEGPWLGGSPVFGAVIQTVCCMAFAHFCGLTIANALPWYELGLHVPHVHNFIFGAVCGPLNIWLK